VQAQATGQRPETHPLPSYTLSRPEALFGGTIAALVAGMAMLVLRSTLGVRSVPERVLEWLLLFVPPGAFESLLQRFGFEAKRYGLDAAAVVMLGVLAVVGYAALRASRQIRGFGLLAIGLWLFVMLVIMPLTSAGVFATDLQDGQIAAVGGYLGVALSYTAVLAIARLWFAEASQTTASSAAPEMVDRRLTLGLIGAAGVTYLATYAASALLPRGSSVPSVLILDPQEPVPSGGVDEPNAHPQSIATPEAGPSQTQTSEAQGLNLPEPPTERQLARDKDGAVVTSTREPGTLAAPMTANADFYVVTKNAGGDPSIHPGDWHLLVDGEVERAFQLDYASLRKLPSVEITKTLECISNFVGKPELAPFGAELISTAVWRGVRLGDVLQLSGGVKPGARVLCRCRSPLIRSV
jgi:hypothetical protein